MIARRLHQQGLVGKPFATPTDVVSWLGAVQAQDFSGAKWAVGQRVSGTTEGDVEHACSRGEILRTHVMRPTWHLVAAEDIRWLLALTAPRVNAGNGYMYRQSDLDAGTFSRSNAIIAKALEGNRNLTREELGLALGEAGVEAKGLRLTYLVMRAELDAVVCSGPRRGKQFTYALLDERSPHARRLERDEALAELILRYFTGHGPATIRDFVWWTGLTIVDAKKGLEMAGPNLVKKTVKDETYWSSTTLRGDVEDSEKAFLLSTYDELLIGYASFGRLRHGGGGGTLSYNSLLLVNDRVAGSWRRSLRKGTTLVEIAPFERMNPSESEAVAAAVDRYGKFIGKPLALTIEEPSG